MQRLLSLLLSITSVAALIATAAVATAQSPDTNYLQSQPAPIQRNYARPAYPQRANAAPQISIIHPIPGIIVRIDPSSSVQTLSATADLTELRVTSGRANVSVYHPEHNTLLLVDLPGGQTALVKDGLYTFNASTNTVRVLKGEASVLPGTTSTEVKLKEDHEFTFGASPRATEVSFAQARTDLIPGPVARPNYGDGPYYPAYYPYGFYPRPYAFYGYPYGFYGYPYGGYGYPFGFGFGFGVGFGYYGGFHGGFVGFQHWH
jgi:hypothetical protein